MSSEQASPEADEHITAALIDALKEIRQAYLSAQMPLPAGSKLYDALRGRKAIDVPGLDRKTYTCPRMPGTNPKLHDAIMKIFPGDYAGERQNVKSQIEAGQFNISDKGKFVWIANGVSTMTSGNEPVSATPEDDFSKPIHKNTIYYGPPGTGKTYTVREILEKHFPDCYKAVTFHQSYSYEDFVEGIRPVLDSDTIKYTIRLGTFKALCEEAKANPDKEYALLIDEINRGNTSKIFGELITLIEENKRMGESEAMTVTLPYSGEEFGVPSNLYIIGTMNTADRSLALLDTALRRRFDFVHVKPEPELLEGKNINGINLESLLTAMNNRIASLYDEDHCIGHSYFMGLETIDDLAQTFRKKLTPLLEEYFPDEHEKVLHVLGGAPFFTPVTPDPYLKKMYGNGKLEQLRERWTLDTNALKESATYTAIYNES